MNAEVPAEILSLHPKVRHPLKFGSESDQFYAERVDPKRRFPLTEWQLQLLMEMDGAQNFGTLIEEVELKSNIKLSLESIRLFYTWLYEEDLISTISQTPEAQESIFEMVMGTKETSKLPEEKKISRKTIQFPKLHVGNWDQVLKAACYAVTVLGVVRIAWVIAPVFEPALQRASFDIAGLFQEGEDTTPKVATTSSVTAERTISSSKEKFISVAGKFDQIKLLREQLAACRIRRDEYYLQSDESGYRKEVESMTSITRRIGELELSD